jgi:hypothetical protein
VWHVTPEDARARQEALTVVPHGRYRTFDWSVVGEPSRSLPCYAERRYGIQNDVRTGLVSVYRPPARS